MNISYAQHQIIVVNPFYKTDHAPSLTIFWKEELHSFQLAHIELHTHTMEIHLEMKNGRESNMNTGTISGKRVCHQGKKKGFTYQDAKSHLNQEQCRRPKKTATTTTSSAQWQHWRLTPIASNSSSSDGSWSESSSRLDKSQLTFLL